MLPNTFDDASHCATENRGPFRDRKVSARNRELNVVRCQWLPQLGRPYTIATWNRLNAPFAKPSGQRGSIDADA